MSNISGNVLRQLYQRNSNAAHELIFYAENIPALGYTSYFIEKSNKSHNHNKHIWRKTKKNIDGYHPLPSINTDTKDEPISIGNDVRKDYLTNQISNTNSL